MAVINGLQILAFGVFAVAFRFLFSNSSPLTVAVVVILEMFNVFHYSAEAAIMPEVIPKYLLEDGVGFGRIDNGVVPALASVIGTFVYGNLSFSPRYCRC